jgi:di/tricarboxylate transporter
VDFLLGQSVLWGLWALMSLLFVRNVLAVRNVFLLLFLTITVFFTLYLGFSLLPANPSLTPIMQLVLSILAFTVFLFAFEIVRVDVAAILVMLLIGLISVLPGLTLVPASQLFNGFASNAVISIIAVIIIGAALDKTGAMNNLARFILRVGGKTEARVIPAIAGTVGTVSSFMQNVGAAALFLPVVRRIAQRTGLPMSRLLMPMAFAAILGGTITMVGSSPLILLNDLIQASNVNLPPEQQMQPFSLFAVTPIGLALLAAGILYFVLFGRFVLPVRQERAKKEEMINYLQRVYGWEGVLRELVIAPRHSLVGQTVAAIEKKYGVYVVAMANFGQEVIIAPPPFYEIKENQRLALFGSSAAFVQFQEQTQTVLRPLTELEEVLSPQNAGIVEVVVPPSSSLIGRTPADIGMRQHYGLNVLTIHRDGKNISENLRDTPLKAGDTLVCFGSWEKANALSAHREDLALLTQETPYEDLRPEKMPFGLFFMALSLGLILFTDMLLSLALFIGALGMILSGVLRVDEAYKAVDWKTVFLLASLIPLGLAVENTGTAAWIAQQTLSILGEVPIWVLQAVVAILATAFTLVMSNVGATVLLVPLAVNIALAADANPAIFALIVGLATSNSFILPTHQVNALIMGPGGYRVADFLRAGGIMTVLFLVVMLIMLNVVF